jgi:uncharacterized membrane protein YkvA (DUF1232 family)
VVLESYNLVWRPPDFGSGLGMFLLPGWVLIAWILAVALLALPRREHVRALAGFVPDCLILVGRLLGDSRITRRRKLLLVVLLGYLAMPIDPIPDLVPILGQVDDALVFAFVLQRFVRGGGEPLVRQHWPGPDLSLQLVLRLAKA